MKIKKLKIKLNKDNEYSDYRYFIPKSNNIKMTDGRDVDEAVQSLKDKIANLKGQANYLISKAPLVKYAEGTSITITDCAEAPLRKISIEGDSYQETREGYNLLPIETINTTINDVTVTNNGDGSLTLNGTAKAYTAITLFSGKQINLSADTYLVSKKEISGTYTTSSQFLELQNGENQRVMMFGGIAGNVSLSQEKVVAKGYIAFAGDTVFNNYRFALSLVNSKNAEKPYEQYGVMPSMEFESPIKNVGDNINLFNKDNATILNAYFTTSNTISSKSGSDTMIILPIEKNTTYAISKILELNSSGNVLRVGTTTEYPAYGVTLNQRVGSQGGTLTETVITTSDNDNYLVAFVHSNRTGNIYSQREILTSVKICKGTSTGAYSPYEQGSIRVYNVNKNFLNIDSGITSQGITTVLNEDGSVQFSMEEVIVEETIDGAACSLDGSGC